MDDTPLPMTPTPKKTIKESFEINQKEKNYKLNIEIIDQEIILNLLDKKDLMKEYEIKLTFDKLKEFYKIFLTLNSSQDFIDFIKASIENKKILIKKNKDNQITIELMIEYLFKQNIIEFDLIQKKMNLELIVQDLSERIEKIKDTCKIFEMNSKRVTEENNIIKDENKKMKEDIDNLKKENNKMREDNKKLINEYIVLKEKIESIEYANTILIDKISNLEININNSRNDLVALNKNNKLISIVSAIIENQDEFEMINSAIEQKMNKKIIELKKIYQSTRDGGDSAQFHKLCDGIPNTLVLYKSAGDRRFGGFASQFWNSDNDVIEDENCFLFSLDKKKIYYSKKDNFQIADYSYDGPSFALKKLYIIRILRNALVEKTLGTAEEGHKDIFDGDQNALSEDGKYKGVYAKEYEVFQIIFKK